MADEQHSEYRNISGMGVFARPDEDKTGSATAAITGFPDGSTRGREESADVEGIPGPESPGWSTVARLTNLQSFR